VLAEDTDGADRLSHLRHLQERESPEEALPRVTVDFARGGDGWVQVGSGGGLHGEAQVCVVRPGRRLHVVGVSPMAEQLREMLAAGAAPGWALLPVPPGQTPLHEIAGRLRAVSGAVRIYNLLLREGFATAEEVAATPDGYLLLLNQCGPMMVAAIRQVVREMGLDFPRASRSAPDNATAERVTHVTSLLAGAQRERYRDFAEMLARSPIPHAVLATIAGSLNGEALPPADPVVCLLLDTEGEAGVAAYYRRTHAPLPGALPSAEDPLRNRGPAAVTGQGPAGTPAH
jgi:hypothetical protein